MTTTTAQNIRRRIRDHLASLSTPPRQSDIGQAINRTQTWVSHYLSGRHDADVDTLIRLCDFLELDLCDLIHDRRPGAPTQGQQIATLINSLTPPEQGAIRAVIETMARPPASRRSRKR